MTIPRVSIVMPVYNCGNYVKQAVDSIRCQSFGDWELLIIDDGSTDDTVARLREIDDHRVVVLVGEKNVGLPRRLNELIERAQGSIIARMDGDDIAHPDRLARQLHFLDRQPNVDVVACGMVVADAESRIVGLNRQRRCSHEHIVKRPWTGFHMNHATWVGRAEWFKRYRYDERALSTEDDELLLRAYQTSRFARLPDVLYAYRVTSLNLTKILKARLRHSRWLAVHALRQRQARLLLGIPVHAVKSLVDIFAIVSGLRYRVLRHRAGKVPTPIASFWNRLLSEYRVRVPVSS